MNPYSNQPRTITIDTQKVVENKIDAILSSVRPFSEDEGYAELQRKAIQSWFDVAKQVVLFNMESDTLGWRTPGLFYVGPKSNPPSVKEMLEYLRPRQEDEVVAVVNADITLGHAIGKLPRVALNNSLGRAWACTSLRQNIDLKTGTILPPADFGLDFFCSTVRIWNDIAAMMPGVLQIGKTVWDNWLNGQLLTYIDPSKYFDITPWKAVIHPLHEGHFRLGHEEQDRINEVARSIQAHGLPRRKLGIPT